MRDFAIPEKSILDSFIATIVLGNGIEVRPFPRMPRFREIFAAVSGCFEAVIYQININSKNIQDWFARIYLISPNVTSLSYPITVGRRYSSHATLQRPPPLAPKPTVFTKNDVNSFCRYPNYNQKLLIPFFMKSLRFLAKPEKRVFMPRPVNKASHQVPN